MSNETDIEKTPELRLDSFAGYNDAYGEGFADGRRSMATSVARLLFDKMTDEAIAEVTGLPTALVTTIRNPDDTKHPENANEIARAATTTGGGDASAFSLVRENPILGTTLVEPSFVRLVRLVNNITQASLAKLLGVHERTVCTWETAEMPIRMKAATYSKLLEISDVKLWNPEETTS